MHVQVTRSRSVCSGVRIWTTGFLGGWLFYDWRLLLVTYAAATVFFLCLILLGWMMDGRMFERAGEDIRCDGGR